MTPPDSTRSVLVDTDALVGWFYERDAHHQRAIVTFDHIREQRLTTTLHSLVVAETATVLSYRQGQSLARQFLNFAAHLPVIHITDDLQQEILNLFSSLEKKGSSVVDCANVVVMRRFNIPLIFAFDEVYSKTFHLTIAA